MIFFKNDYGSGAHPKVLEALVSTNMENTVGYGMDEYTAQAADAIRAKVGCPDAAVYLTMAGTQTNLTVIGATLRPHEAVISAETGHVCVHEAGAIEATGHKVIHVPTEDGKLRPADIDKVMKQHCNAHWVRPKMIYISNLTETGLTYNKAELKALREKCDEHGLYVFMDGARLAMALTQKDNDLKFTDLPELCDVFYIGGTKCGVLFGEAIVIVNDSMKPDFNRIMKQKGAVLAKGRLLGVQFKAMFDGDLYLELGQHCNDLAQQLISAIAGNGYEFMWPPCSNMIFPIFPLSVVKKLDEAGVLYDDFEEVGDGNAAMRLCTSWSTTQEEVDEFIKLIEK